ncbi:MAG TPA: lipocalin family protein [bacterium]|nr:lipocalin family protein [bacterium]
MKRRKIYEFDHLENNDAAWTATAEQSTTRLLLYGFLLLIGLALVISLSGCAVTDNGDELPAQAAGTHRHVEPADLAGDDDDDSTDPWSSAEAPALDRLSEIVFADLTPDGDTVANVDLTRYLGVWYEIATYEQFFQRGCTGVTATYGLNDNGTISVLNECRVGSLDGRYKAIEGFARVRDKATNAKLLVYFTPLFGAPYWIIELDGQDGDQPYEWAVVGSASDRYLWILSRTPQMDDARLSRILERLVERGYDLDKLSFTLQPDA